ncbi:hypothetical protein BCL57_002137 [Agromyces flavus]|uniref:Uncharacterized protein n=1 Tax=Agromyces flavus TaxID=589382 RepID=A0A1H1P8Y6_9MICO|nr:hypothetical protein [Agromyces flavus]MCP2367978.1 hypothetical protein [Agromyces flavus]GGI47440.1 hypothetical protein GCM10010932_21280 [Agromyces flavus]SDS07089.1 hypothetical protein SAMN04489721_0724 [Agromyces flavus]
MLTSESAEPQEHDTADVVELVDRIVAEELEALRRAFGEGAEFAITRAGRRDETLHRLECPSVEPHLDRRARWTDEHRRRLAADDTYRIPLPALLTRERAGAISGMRGCKVCWPNLSGTEPRPLKRITARGLRPQHAGRVIATPTGESLGTIIRSTPRRGADLFGVEHDEIEVVTSSRTIRYAPDEDVHLWDLPSDSQAIERKLRLFTQLGSGPSPAA